MNDAEHYQQHKDDSSEWEEVAEPRRPSRRLGSMISVRFSDAEAQLVRAAASRHGASVSAFVREAALTAAGARQTTTWAQRVDAAPDVGTFAAWSVKMNGAALAVSGNVTALATSA